MPISNIILQKCLCFTVLPAQTENQAPAQSFPKALSNRGNIDLYVLLNIHNDSRASVTKSRKNVGNLG